MGQTTAGLTDRSALAALPPQPPTVRGRPTLRGETTSATDVLLDESVAAGGCRPVSRF